MIFILACSWQQWSSRLLAVACASAMALLSSSGSAWAGCPGGTEASPGYRSYLPDCRAYELVTPPYVDGQPATGISREPPPISPDGNHVLGIDFAGLAGTENEENDETEFGAVYEFSRTPSGWSTESLEPPASQYPRQQFVAASTDLTRSLWQLVVPSEVGEESPIPDRDAFSLALREPASPGGSPSFTVVGPVASPGHESGPQSGFGVDGASSDLSHVLLGVKAERKQLWPGDTTREGARSLYEYVGTGVGEPALVGVKNAGPLKGKPHVNDGAELVSECGTTLGSRVIVEGAGVPGTTYNAVSASGAVVYFTALHAGSCAGSEPAVNEIYARINGSQTVAVSEPAMTSGRETECAGVCREDEREENGHKRSPALFEGASGSGTRVFFTTTQPLLNGDEDNQRDLYEAELEGGTVKSLVQVSHDPNKGQAGEVFTVARVSSDGARVYYVAKGVLTTQANGNGEKAEQGAYNLYLSDVTTGKTVFVASLLSRLEEEELAAKLTQERTLQCEELSGVERIECEEHSAEHVAEKLAKDLEQKTQLSPQDEHRPFETRASGRFLLFPTARHLTGAEDTSTVPQIFEYDAQTETLARVAIGQKGSYLCAASGKVQEGFNCNGNTTNVEDAPTMLETPAYATNTFPTDSASGLSLSTDGAAVFTSAAGLTLGATNNHPITNPKAGRPIYTANVYEYREGNVSLISPGDEATTPEVPGTTRLLGTDETGENVFFFTPDSLVPQDPDTQASWYDARIGGGFPAPATLSGCVGETCRGALSAAPLLASGNSTAAGEGNLSSSPAVKPLMRTQKLAKALKACRAKHNKRKRASCEAQARRKYSAPHVAKRANRRAR